jgi:hypothetical protein
MMSDRLFVNIVFASERRLRHYVKRYTPPVSTTSQLMFDDSHRLNVNTSWMTNCEGDGGGANVTVFGRADLRDVSGSGDLDEWLMMLILMLDACQ